MSTKVMKSIRLARAIMLLRGMNARQVSEHTGLSVENLAAWLRGSNNALSASSYVTLFGFLGVNKKGLSTKHIHIWNLHTHSGNLTAQQKEALKEVAPLLAEGAILEVTSKKPEFTPINRLRAFIVKGQSARVLVHIHGFMKDPQGIDPGMLPGTAWRTHDNNSRFVVKLDRLYWNAVKAGSITRSEFDDIYSENFDKCSWNDVRLIARERGITPSMITQMILSREIDMTDNGKAPDLDTFFSTDWGADSALPDFMTHHEGSAAPQRRTQKRRANAAQPEVAPAPAVIHPADVLAQSVASTAT